MTRSPRPYLLTPFTLLAVLALVAPGPPLARAQSQATTGVVEGTVVDPSGAPVAGVSVVLKNTATNLERALVTDADGRFRGLLLPLGPYRVTASLQGCWRYSRTPTRKPGAGTWMSISCWG